VPFACRHCEDPYCMADCPTDAINRAPSGEVFINDKCIGCGNCKANCPYDAIQMSAPHPEHQSLFSWFLFGANKHEEDHEKGNGAASAKLAKKCDSCMNIEGGPSCVRACPTGAAFRVSPGDYFLPPRLT
jgi:cGMP-dependent protein kinase 2